MSFHSETGRNSLLFTNPNQTDARPSRFVMETDSYHAAALAVSRGDAICLGIFPYMNPWLAAGKIETIEQFRCDIKHAAYLVYAPHNQHNPSIPRLHQWLVNFLTRM